MSDWLELKNKLPTITTADKTDAIIGFSNMPISKDIPLSIEFSYLNGLPYPITIIKRNGLAFTMPCQLQNWRQYNELTIFVKYRFNANVKFDVHHVLNDEVNAPNDVKALDKAFKSSKRSFYTCGNEAVVAYHVTRQSFEKCNGSIYLEDLDITIAADTDGVNTVHPDSDVGFHLRNKEKPLLGFSYRILINDPEDLYGDRFVNMGTRVYRIKKTIDPEKDPGVYLCVTSDDHTEINEIYHSFDTADTDLMLYKTASDAKVYGNIIETRKKEYEEQQHLNKLQVLKLEADVAQLKATLDTNVTKLKDIRAVHDAELAKQSAVYKEEETTFKIRLSKLEAQLAEEKIIRNDHYEKRKLNYEERSMDRKDTSEFIKWVPALIAGCFIAGSKFKLI